MAVQSQQMGQTPKPVVQSQPKLVQMTKLEQKPKEQQQQQQANEDEDEYYDEEDDDGGV